MPWPAGSMSPTVPGPLWDGTMTTTSAPAVDLAGGRRILTAAETLMAAVINAAKRITNNGKDIDEYQVLTERVAYLATEIRAANDLLTFGVKPDGLDPTYGRLGAWAVQSETSGAAGLGAQPYRDNGRDLALLPDDRTVQVGCYDDQAAVVVFDKNGKLDKSFAGTGILQYPHAAPFFKVAVSPDGKRVAASSQSVTDASLVVTLKVGN